MSQHSESRNDLQPGPCIVCGLRNYSLSFGGPTICPSCDCGNTGPNIVRRQPERIRELESAARSEIEYTHAARWHFGVEHGWPSFHKQIHPTEKMLGWRMPSQNPPDGVSFDPADYQYYESAEAAIDAAMKANRQGEAK